MIAYFFPPEGNAGTYRPLRFARSLSHMRWRVNVLSVDPYQYERYDPELLDAVPKDVNVLRVRGRDLWQEFHARRGKKLKAELSVAPQEKLEEIYNTHYAPFRSRMREIVRKLEGWYYLPDRAKSWIRPTVNASIQLCTSAQPNAIWATIGPVSSGVVAQEVSEQTGVPYVLDFRDPWGLNYYETDYLRPKVLAMMAGRTMYRILKQAQSVVFLFDTIAECYQRAYPGALEDKKIHIIPNGYDGSLQDFDIPKSKKCTILYAGTLSTYRYDTLLQALLDFKSILPEQARKLHLRFVGDSTERFQRDVQQLKLSDMIEIRPSTSYANILRLQREAHALLILGRGAERKGHELVAGAKLFEYLKARRPIIGVLPNDETRKILENAGVVTIADVDAPHNILWTFRKVYDEWQKGTLSDLLPNRTVAESYSGTSQAEALIRALNGEMAKQPFISGRVNIPPSLQEDMVS